jgi:hypothetical protein
MYCFLRRNVAAAFSEKKWKSRKNEIAEDGSTSASTFFARPYSTRAPQLFSQGATRQKQQLLSLSKLSTTTPTYAPVQPEAIVFPSRPSLKLSRTTTSAPMAPPTHCRRCNLTFSTWNDYHIHKTVSRHHIYCVICSHDFKSTDAYKRHHDQVAYDHLLPIRCSI